MKRARVSALLLPGIGTVDDLRMAVDCGVAPSASPRTARRPTSPEQHIGLSRKLGVDTVGFLMMAHMIEPEALLVQAEAHGGLRRATASTSPTPPATCCRTT